MFSCRTQQGNERLSTLDLWIHLVAKDGWIGRKKNHPIKNWTIPFSYFWRRRRCRRRVCDPSILRKLFLPLRHNARGGRARNENEMAMKSRVNTSKRKKKEKWNEAQAWIQLNYLTQHPRLSTWNVYGIKFPALTRLCALGPGRAQKAKRGRRMPNPNSWLQVPSQQSIKRSFAEKKKKLLRKEKNIFFLLVSSSSFNLCWLFLRARARVLHCHKDDDDESFWLFKLHWSRES